MLLYFFKYLLIVELNNLYENISRIKKLMKLTKKNSNDDIEEELSEEGEASSTETSTKTSTGYPTVTKWESGVARGPANPIGNTKRQDKVTRGKANTLL